jgi:hypothetical protein
MRQRQDLLAELNAKYPQYVPIMEHIEWNDSYVKDHYTNKDLKLYWWTSLRDMRTVETMIYAEGLILLYHGKLTHEYLEVACLKIILEKAKDDLLELLDIDNIKETIRNTYNHIMENKEEILKAEKDWRPRTIFSLVTRTHKRKLTKEEFVAMLDECKELTGHKTYHYCVEYFVANTGLSARTFSGYLKKYGIVFEEKEKFGGKKEKSGRKNPVWPQHIQPEEWKLSPEEIGKLAIQRCPWIEELKIQTIKNWKYNKLKEIQ